MNSLRTGGRVSRYVEIGGISHSLMWGRVIGWAVMVHHPLEVLGNVTGWLLINVVEG